MHQHSAIREGQIQREEQSNRARKARGKDRKPRAPCAVAAVFLRRGRAAMSVLRTSVIAGIDRVEAAIAH
jgi:hypothetical protein